MLYIFISILCFNKKYFLHTMIKAQPSLFIHSSHRQQQHLTYEPQFSGAHYILFWQSAGMFVHSHWRCMYNMTSLPSCNLFYISAIHRNRLSDRFIFTACSHFWGTAKELIAAQSWQSHFLHSPASSLILQRPPYISHFLSRKQDVLICFSPR